MPPPRALLSFAMALTLCTEMANKGAPTAGASQLREGVDMSALNSSSSEVATFDVWLVNAKEVETAMTKLQRTLRVWRSLPKLEPTMPKVARGVRKQHTLKPVCKRCAIYGAPFPPVTECDHAWLASDEAMA